MSTLSTHHSLPTAAAAAATGKLDVETVPFVEMADGKLRGVVSSGSDIHRVYVSFLEGRTGNYYCCTNNNRPCGGLGGALHSRPLHRTHECETPIQTSC